MPVNNPSSVFGSLDWFNVQDYGAVGDSITDDTSAIQSTINACSSAGGGTVYFPAGIYIVGGALQNITGANAQLILPDIDADTDQQLSIKFLGAFPQYPNPSIIRAVQVPINGSIIKCTLNSGTDGNLIGGVGTGDNPPFSNIQIWFENLTFRLHDNPVLTALDLENCTGADLKNVIIDCGNYSILDTTEPSTTISYGVKMPANNNGVPNNINGLTVINFYNGVKLSEHAIVDDVKIFGCKYATEIPAAYHALYIKRIMCAHNESVLHFTGGDSYIVIDELDIEHYSTAVAGAKWFEPIYDIDDANNYGYGQIIRHTVLANSGVSTTFIKNGGNNLYTSRLGSTSLASGWVDHSTFVWTYVSATSFKVVGVDLTGTFMKGTRLRWVQTTQKFGVVASSTYSGGDTTVNLIPTDDYAVTNAAISFQYYSYVPKPQGCPNWFNYTPTFTGFSADPSNYSCRWMAVGNLMTMMFRAATNGTSNANTYTQTLPVVAATVTNAVWLGTGSGVDGGSALAAPIMWNIQSGASTVGLFKDMTGASGWATSLGKKASFIVIYEY